LLEGFANEKQGEICVIYEFIEGCGNLQMILDDV